MFFRRAPKKNEEVQVLPETNVKAETMSKVAGKDALSKRIHESLKQINSLLKSFQSAELLNQQGSLLTATRVVAKDLALSR